MVTERQSTMRKLFAIILALTMIISGLPAMAAPGDCLIYDYEGDYEKSVRGMAKLGEYIYILPQYGDALYRWSVSGGFEELELAEGLLVYEDGYMTLNAFVAGESSLYALCTYVSYDDDDAGVLDDALLWRVEISDGKADFVDPVSMDWDDMIDYYDDYENPRDTYMPFIADDKLVFYTYDDGGENVLGVCDIENGDCELYDELGGVAALCAYKDGYALALTSEYVDDGIECALYEFNISTGETRLLCEMPSFGYTAPSGLIYSSEQDMVYYALGGELHAMRDFEPTSAVAVASLNIRGTWAGIMPILLDDGRYVITDGEKVIARVTDPSQRNATKLTVHTDYNSALESAYGDFTAAHGDVDVVLTGDIMDVSDAMMSRDSSVDIYCLYVHTDDYAALFARGYLAELTGSEKLSACASEMYEGVRKSIYREGELVAIPISRYADCWGYNMAAFEAAGLTEADVPGSWEELLQLLPTLPERLAGHDEISVFGTYFTQTDLRWTLFYGLLNNYMLYMQNDPNAAQTFDNAKLAEMFDSIMAMDFGALGYSEEYEEHDEGFDYNIVTVDDARSTLFSEYASASPNVYAIANDMRPMPMSIFAGDEPFIGATMCVMIVNPYSENRELAIEYIECALDRIAPELVTALSPGVNEPVINEYYDEGVASYEEWVASVEAEIAKCTDVDELAQWQTQLEEARKYLEEYRVLHKYDLSDESIAAYREYGAYIVAQRDSPLYADGNYDEVFAQIDKFLQGNIGASEMLKNINKKYQMIILEGL